MNIRKRTQINYEQSSLKYHPYMSDPVDKTRGILKSDEYILLETCRDKLYANF